MSPVAELNCLADSFGWLVNGDCGFTGRLVVCLSVGLVVVLLAIVC